jgi:hypothetical protein
MVRFPIKDNKPTMFTLSVVCGAVKLHSPILAVVFPLSAVCGESVLALLHWKLFGLGSTSDSYRQV